MTRSAAMTKSAILIAAREQFARHGYHRATVRAVAAAAAIDPAMVMRYFGSKAGLFEAAVTVDLELPDLSSVPAGQVGHTLIRHFLTRWEQDDTLVILLRSSIGDSEFAEHLRQVFLQQVAPTVQPAAEPSSAAHRAGLVATQILGLATARYVLELPPVVAMSHEEIIAWVGPTLQHYLRDGGPLGAHPSEVAQ
ncbi:MAG TPA: TetR family transcriptional regulator [Ruania sp.]|nr:TetR family transcriptional regulator [Ruania sp.]